MLRVYDCVTEQHDLRLVVVAGLICFLACYTAISLLARTRAASGPARDWWLAGAAFVAGCGVWSTHFVAMLAFKSVLPIGYDVGLTALSVVIAVAITWLGYFVALRRPEWAAIGGAVAGAAVGAMHYTGMAAVRVPGIVHYDTAYVLVSLVVGAALGAAALHFASVKPTVGGRVTAASTFAAGICILHFTGMAAVGIESDPRIPFPDQFLAREWLAVTIAAVTVLIVALGLAGSVFDQHLAARAMKEAEQLRRHVTELETTKQELEETAKRLVSALEAASAGSQAKSQFLATMSHELRTPLNAVIGFAELLSTEAFGPIGDPRYREFAVEIRHSGAHLLDLINDVLDLSKLDAGRLELSEEEVDPHRIVDDAVAMLKMQAEDSGIALELALGARLPALFVDSRRVRQVLVNLISNAVKFTPEGGKVTIGAFRHAGNLTIAVADTGIGIAPEDIPKALERFGQIDSTLSRQYDGTGLGLPLSKRLMELHDGTLEIESAVGAGTNVSITFPAKRVRDPASHLSVA
jgi:signal transduction histidine kinase